MCYILCRQLIGKAHYSKFTLASNSTQKLGGSEQVFGLHPGIFNIVFCYFLMNFCCYLDANQACVPMIVYHNVHFNVDLDPDAC